jgi:signal transduction histidine kinase
MKGLPLRVKVALWAALTAAAAMGVALVGIHYFLRGTLMDEVDNRLYSSAAELTWALDQHPGGPVENRTEITEELMPPSVANRLVELVDDKGKVWYRSQNLSGQSLNDTGLGPREITFGEDRYRVVTRYHKFLIIHVGTSLRAYYANLDTIRLALLIALPAVALFSMLGGLWVAGRAMRPVADITAAAEHITAEALSQRLPVPPALDEIHQLTEVLNKTFARLETSYNQAIHFASDASHQLKTPIAVMRVGIDTLMKQRDMRPEHVAELSDLLQQTRRLTSLADGLLLLARADAGRLEVKAVETDLIPLIEGCTEDAEILAAPHGLRIERDLPVALSAFADAPRTEQILLNMLENAIKYNRPRGTITLTAGTDEEGVFVVVANTGPPIPGDKMPHIFNRFTRGETDESKSGHGLGLSIARELARAQGGELRLLRSDAELTEFELRLRAVAAPAKAAVDPAPVLEGLYNQTPGTDAPR